MSAAAAMYTGPQCPRCDKPLPDYSVYDGTIICPSCTGEFEGTVFHPVERQVQAPRIAAETPEGANVCATHPRNAAVTSCQRCGLFICSLCDMNLGTGSFCPSCFERVRAEGALDAAPRRYRDYTGIAWLCILGGFLVWFLMLPISAFAIYCAVKGLRQARERGRPRGGAIAAIIFGVLELVTSIGIIALFVYAIANA
ncbi:MAG TPA: hypothetical protein VF846_09185 [Thermoanaerobaculia bacterium]|jgi:ribosomal protein L37AE/L43A